MLLPALGRAKSAARDISCAGNLKQLGFASLNYIDDYSDWCYSYYYPSAGGGWDSYAVYPYLNNGGVFACPSEIEHWNYNNTTGLIKKLSYGPNSTIFAGDTSGTPVLYTPKVKFNQVKKPYKKLLLSEPRIEITWNPVGVRCDYKIPGSPTYLGYYHNRTCNAVFGDGHVEKTIKPWADDKVMSFQLQTD
jgi:prepilin-type processing-associated H-X9-DG protein